MTDLSNDVPPYSRIEADQILNEAIDLALKWLKDDDGFVPFCIGIRIDGQREIMALNREDWDSASAMQEGLLEHVSNQCAALRYRCVAFTQSVYVRNLGQNCIQITIQQPQQKHVSCYVPFNRLQTGGVETGEISATEPVYDFYSGMPEM